MTFPGHGIYYISHANVAHVRMGLADGGSSADKTNVVVWDDDTQRYDHLWLIEPVKNEVDTYTIRNLYAGTYMDLTQSRANDGTNVIGYHPTGNDNQKWIIRKDEANASIWKIQCKATGTFLDLYQGGGSGTIVVGWQGRWADNSGGHQSWLFESVGIFGAHVSAVLDNSPFTLCEFKALEPDTLYLIPVQEYITSVWKKSGLGVTRCRNKIFDSDEFATVMKAEMDKWGNQTFKADGFDILLGIMYGEKCNAKNHAYNWTINGKDHTKLKFFEPQDGAYSDDACGYIGLAGIY